MSTHWARLGTALRSARTQRGLRQEDVAAELGIKRGALANIEHGKGRRITSTIRSYARLVGWTDDSPERVLAGGDPTPATPPGARDTRAPTSPAPDSPTAAIPTEPLADPAEREIWAMRYVPEPEKIELIAAYRARRVTAELQSELETCRQEGIALRQQVDALQRELRQGPQATCRNAV